MTDLCVPGDLWEGDPDEAVIAAWLYAEGAQVAAGSVVAQLMVEKAQLDLVAPASGRLAILAPAETVVHRGTCVGRIG